MGLAVVKEEQFLNERCRAEDILLGSLGFAEEAKILSIKKTATGYAGEGCYTDGETFVFECEEDLDDLQCWALGVLDAKGLS